MSRREQETIHHPYKPMQYEGQEEQCAICGANKKWELNHVWAYEDGENTIVGNGKMLYNNDNAS